MILYHVKKLCNQRALEVKAIKGLVGCHAEEIKFCRCRHKLKPDFLILTCLVKNVISRDYQRVISL
jgi:hypothetical protein